MRLPLLGYPAVHVMRPGNSLEAGTLGAPQDCAMTAAAAEATRPSRAPAYGGPTSACAHLAASSATLSGKSASHAALTAAWPR